MALDNRDRIVGRILKNTGWLYLKMFVSFTASFVSTRFILAALGIEDYGIYNIIGGSIGMLGFLNSAMANATQRFISYTQGEGNLLKQKQIFNIGIFIHGCISLFMVIALIVAGFLFFRGILNIPSERIEAAKIIYAALILSTVFSIMSVPYNATINAHEDMRYFSIVGIAESILKLGVAITCVYWGGDRLILYGVLLTVISLLSLSVLRLYCYKRYEECVLNIKEYFNVGLLKEMTSFAGWNFLTAISSLVTHQGLGIVINHFFGVALNAAQGVAHQLAGAISVFDNNLMKAINPILVKSEGFGNRQRMIYITLAGCRFSFFLYGICAVPLILLAPQILNLWLKEVPEWAVGFCQLQALRSLFEKITNSLSTAIYAEGNIRNYTIAKSITNFLPLVIVPIVFSLHWSPYWMYIIWIVCWCFLGGGVLMYYAQRQIGISARGFFKEVLAPCLSIIVSSFFIYYMITTFIHSRFVSLWVLLVTLIVYLFMSWMLLFNKEERDIVLKKLYAAIYYIR